MADIFISFIHEEKELAEVVQRLIAKKLEGAATFIASEWQIHAGEDWLQRIRSELQPSKVVVLMLSPRSVSRPWVNFEAGAAWLTGKAIIPVCYGGLDKGALPKPYSNFQGVNLRTDGYYLITSLAHHLKTIPPPPQLEDYEIVNEMHDELRAMLDGKEPST